MGDKDPKQQPEDAQPRPAGRLRRLLRGERELSQGEKVLLVGLGALACLVMGLMLLYFCLLRPFQPAVRQQTTRPTVTEQLDEQTAGGLWG